MNTKKKKISKKAGPSCFNKENSGKTRELLKELIRAGKVTKGEGEKFLKKFWKDTGDEREYFKKKVEKLAMEIKERIGAPSREEFEALKKRVEELERKK